MAKVLEFGKKAWGWFANVWLIKDVAIAIAGATAIGAVSTALIVWAATPMSPLDFVGVAAIGGLATFAIAIRFAPKVRHVHHLPIPAETKPEASLAIKFMPAGTKIENRGGIFIGGDNSGRNSVNNANEN